jgi:hypothetical protein
MKIRNGFVSNSSSSSFLVVFDKLPEDALDVHRLLFGPEPSTVSVYDNAAKTIDVAQQVWEDIKEQLDKLPYSKEFVFEEFENEAYIRAYNEFEPRRNALYRAGKNYNEVARLLEDEEEARRNQLQKELSDVFLQRSEGKVILSFTYSDKKGEFEALLEHGDIFNHLQHVRISNH